VYDEGMSTSTADSTREVRQRALWQRTAAVAGRLNRAQGELVEIAAELIGDGHWGDGGFRSPQHYLVVRAGLSPEHAADVVRVATRRAELTRAAAALAAGELSLDQVAVLARRTPAAYQATATELARHATVPQLRRAMAPHAFPNPGTAERDSSDTGTGEPGKNDQAAPDARDGGEYAAAAGIVPDTRSGSERRACARAELSMRYDDDGRFQLRYSAAGHIGALVEQAIREAKDALFTASQGRATGGENRADDGTDEADEGTTIGAGWNHAGRPTYADALAEIARRSLETITSTSRAAHYRVYLHLSTDGAWVGGGHAIPIRLLGRFICDGTVQPVWETEGRPVSVGRTMRILPDRTRRLIHDRDRGCRFPGCTATGHLEVHHLDAWADGGRTDEDRQILVCAPHHDGIDRGDYTITGDPARPDGLRVTNGYGVPIRPPTPAETSPPPEGDPHCPALTYAPPTGGPISWPDLQLGPDGETPEDPPHERRLSLVRTAQPERELEQDHVEELYDDLVYDSYRRRRS
jgi:hypothetical protein